MRSKGVRRVAVVVALVAVMVVGRVYPAGAFLSSLDPAGWAVVAQMAAIISQAVAIKRQVENVRNQSRAEYFGKLAPLSGKLAVVSGWMRNARNRAGAVVYNPASSRDLLPATLPVFNRPLEECAPGVDPCMPPLSSATLPVSTIGTLAGTVRANVGSSGSPNPIVSSYTANDVRLRQMVDRLEARAQDNIVRAEAAAVRAENDRAVRRAVIEEQMAIVEDWRGCQEAPPGAWTPPPATTDDRLPCMTNDGLGREDTRGGTQGAQSDLVAKLDALELYQDGDVSKVQIDTIQTQLIVMLGRLQAARIEREAVQMEAEQEALMVFEARRRRDLMLVRENLRCQDRFGVQSYFEEEGEQATPPRGSCRQLEDVTAAALATAANNCLLPGAC